MEPLDRPTAIWWIRRDLRLQDNQALQAALEYSTQVVPLFILDEKLLESAYVGEKRLALLLPLGLRIVTMSSDLILGLFALGLSKKYLFKKTPQSPASP